MRTQLLAAIILTSLVSVGISNAADKSDKKQEREKCYGVAKAAKNDCAAKDGSHACAGHAKKDRDLNTWIYVPKGVCDKIAGGIKG